MVLHQINLWAIAFSLPKNWILKSRKYLSMGIKVGLLCSYFCSLVIWTNEMRRAHQHLWVLMIDHVNSVLAAHDARFSMANLTLDGGFFCININSNNYIDFFKTSSTLRNHHSCWRRKQRIHCWSSIYGLGPNGYNFNFSPIHSKYITSTTHTGPYHNNYNIIAFYTYYLTPNPFFYKSLHHNELVKHLFRSVKL